MAPEEREYEMRIVVGAVNGGGDFHSDSDHYDYIPVTLSIKDDCAITDGFTVASNTADPNEATVWLGGGDKFA
jgi:hypothetical protein